MAQILRHLANNNVKTKANTMKKILIVLAICALGHTGATAQTTTRKQSTTIKQHRNADGSLSGRTTSTRTTTRRQVPDPHATDGTRFPTGTYQTPTGTQPDYNATRRARTGGTAASRPADAVAK